MNAKKRFICIAFILSTLNSFGQIQENSFENIYNLLDQNNFFKAKEIYSADKSNLSPVHQKFIEAYLDNTFGKPTQSNEKIAEIVENPIELLHDSLMYTLYSIKADNLIKLYEYKEAKETTEFILEKFNDLLSEEEVAGYQNTLKIWTVLENQPEQTISMNGSAKIKIKKDKFRMKNLPVTTGRDTLDFIFDTGANLSVVTLTVAKKFNMNIFPDYFEGRGATGGKFPARIAVCPEFYLGNIKIQNAVFLVMDDKELTFRILFIKYKVLGIIGYPVIEALKEIQITKDDYFIVPEKETVCDYSNMAMEGLLPLILVEGNPYFFDTGAVKTGFYKPYYLANKEEIESKHKLETIGYMSAGGKLKEKGYVIDAKLTVSDKDVILKKVQVSKEYYFNYKGIWGNIGKDLIEQFDTTTINFKQMFIKFE